jgi:dTDP-4-dehydrorhamnose 3,5-epimerase
LLDRLRMAFKFQPMDVQGVLLIEPTVFQDPRGFFLECYKQSDFEAAGINAQFVQENHSRSAQGVVRGLHYQSPPHGQAKLIRVVEGAIFDVVVDLRSQSATYGRWTTVELSSANRRMLYVPEGCAHGFGVLSNSAEVIYKTTSEYAPEYEYGIRWDDPSLGIRWPIQNPILSDRDRRWPLLTTLQTA